MSKLKKLLKLIILSQNYTSQKYYDNLYIMHILNHTELNNMNKLIDSEN